MTPFEKLSACIDEGRDEMVALQKLLTSFVALAPENGGNGELRKCETLADWLSKNDFLKFDYFDAPDERAECGKRPNMIVTLPGANKSRTVWVMNHLDVVPAGEMSLWKSDPWKVIEKDGRLYGRGVEDNQQGIVAGVFAAMSFIREKLSPAHTVKLLFVSDEEVGSKYGIQHLLDGRELFRKEDLIIIPDGGDPEGDTIEVAEKNLLWLKITVSGKQCHGSRPDEGANAFLAGCDLAVSLNNMEQLFNKRDGLFTPDYSTFQPTKQEANVPNINTIPGEDVFYMDCRILPCYSLDMVRAEVKKRIEAIEQKHKVTIACSEEQAVESPATPVDAPVVEALKAAIKKIYGKDARPVGIGGGTVGAYLRQAGYNAVVWSKMEDTAHQPNESCIIDNIIGDAKVLMSVMLDGYIK